MNPRLLKRHAAAASAAKASSSSDNELAAYTTFPARLAACSMGMTLAKNGNLVYTPAERALMRQVMITTYADYSTCERHKDRVMWTVKIQLAESNHEDQDNCGQCPVRIEPHLCKFEYPAGTFPSNGPIFPAHIQALEQIWKQAAAGASAESVALQRSDAQVARDKIAEMAAWEVYTMAVVDIVGPNLLREYRGLAALTPEQRVKTLTEAKNLPAYEQIARTWNNHTRSRGVANSAFCFMHRAMGHMVPVEGERAYNLQCGVCYDEAYRAAAKANKVFDAAAPSAGEVAQMH